MATKWLLLLVALIYGCHAQPLPPNFIVLVTDDQDYMMNSTHPRYMPQLNRHVVAKGLQLRNFLISTAACCPSRTILMTGRYTHNNNVTSNIEPHGSFWKFMRQALDDDYLPVWLQAAGYRTMHVGKFLNAMDPTDTRFRCPQGWDDWDALVEPYVYMYTRPAFSYNCQPFRILEGEYSTDVVSDKAVSYIRKAVQEGTKAGQPYQPFYLQVTPISPHTACNSLEAAGSCSFPVPATRHRTLFADANLPQAPNFMVPPWPELGLVSDLGAAKAVQNHYVARLRANMAVDEMIGRIFDTLEELGQLLNTYFIFTSDNGYQLGHHAQKQGKQFHWEEITRVPFYIRGPGIPPGVVTDWQGNMVDVAATVMHLSGAGVPAIADGTPIPLAQLLPDYVNPYDSTDGGDGDGSGDLGEGSVGLDLGVGPTEGGFQGTGQGVEPGAEAAAAPPGAAEGGSRRRLQLLVEGKRGKVQQQGRRRARERGQEPGGGGVGLLQSRPLVIEEGFEGPDLLEYDEQGRLVVEAAAERDPVEPGGGIDMGVDGRGVAGVGPGAGAAAGGAGRYGLNSTAAAEAVVQRRRLLVGAYDGGFNRGTREMMPLEMWGHAWDRRITFKDYRVVRLCTNLLFFGEESDYRRAYGNGTFGWGDTLYGSAVRERGGPGLNGGINVRDYHPPGSVAGDGGSYDTAVNDGRRLHGIGTAQAVDAEEDLPDQEQWAQGWEKRLNEHLMQSLEEARRLYWSGGAGEATGALLGGGSTARRAVQELESYELVLRFDYARPIQDNTFAAQKDTTCRFLAVATGASTCYVPGADLAADRLYGNFTVRLVQGCAVPANDFDKAVKEVVEGVQLYLIQSYQSTYGIVALSASWPSPPAAPAVLLPIDFLFHPAVFPAFSRDQLSYTRIMEPEACELLTKALAPYVSYCDLHNVYGLANPSTFVFELRPAGADAAPKLEEAAEQVRRNPGAALGLTFQMLFGLTSIRAADPGQTHSSGDNSTSTPPNIRPFSSPPRPLRPPPQPSKPPSPPPRFPKPSSPDPPAPHLPAAPRPLPRPSPRPPSPRPPSPAPRPPPRPRPLPRPPPRPPPSRRPPLITSPPSSPPRPRPPPQPRAPPLGPARALEVQVTCTYSAPMTNAMLLVQLQATCGLALRRLGASTCVALRPQPAPDGGAATFSLVLKRGANSMEEQFAVQLQAVMDDPGALLDTDYLSTFQVQAITLSWPPPPPNRPPSPPSPPRPRPTPPSHPTPPVSPTSPAHPMTPPHQPPSPAPHTPADPQSPSRPPAPLKPQSPSPRIPVTPRPPSRPPPAPPIPSPPSPRPPFSPRPPLRPPSPPPTPSPPSPRPPYSPRLPVRPPSPPPSRPPARPPSPQLLRPPSPRPPSPGQRRPREQRGPIGTCYKYAVWCFGFKELYDLVLDPYELDNRISQAPKRLLDRLDALMTVVGYCKGREQCDNPYKTLHPDGSVRTFEEAMDRKYDNLYAGLRKFEFLRCSNAYNTNNERSLMSDKRLGR